MKESAGSLLCTHCKKRTVDIEINRKQLCYACATTCMALGMHFQLPKKEREEEERSLSTSIEAFWERTLDFVESKPEVQEWMKRNDWGVRYFRAAIVVPALRGWIEKNK